MSDYSKLASESMKQLTDRVIKADLASRKRKMIYFKAMNAASIIVWLPVTVYTVWAVFTPNGPLLSFNRQAGDAINIWRQVFGVNRIPVYNQDQALKLKSYANITANEVAKNDKLVFKPYVWN